MRFEADLISGTLTPIIFRFAGNVGLTPSERAEVVRIAQGFACKDSAAAANISPETIRARRKHIYKKLDVAGANEVIADLLAHSLAMLARNAGADGATSSSTTTAETQAGAPTT